MQIQKNKNILRKNPQKEPKLLNRICILKKQSQRPISKNAKRGPDLAPLVEELKQKYPQESQSDIYKNVYIKENPLVSIVMTTYNNGKLLTEYSLKSILNQTYKNIEIIVVADHSTDNTDKLIGQIQDSRLIYHNLKTPSNYPGNTKRDIWLIAGSYPFNKGLKLCSGDFITHCDEDDAFTPDRIEKLVQYIQKEKSDLVHHPFHISVFNKIISTNDSSELICGKITTSAVFYHKWFLQLPTDVNCWEIGEPGDWNRYKKFKYIGAKISRYHEPLTYKE